jgi:hypothetical protein
MRESNSHYDLTRSADNSEHDQRNRTQHELIRLAMERRRHADYIDAMLRRAGAGQSPNADAGRRSAAAKPTRDPGE